MVRECSLSVDDLIWPIFLRDGKDDETPVESMPGVARLTVDRAVRAAKDGANVVVAAWVDFRQKKMAPC